VEDMSKTDFKISYAGPAVESGIMDVRDLAPALLSVGKLFGVVNRKLNGDKAEVKVNVVATKAGSFEIILGLDQSYLDHAISLLSGDKVTAAINLKELIIAGTVGTGGVIWLIKKLKGEKPQKIENLGKGKIRITTNTEKFETNIEVWEISNDPNVLNLIEKLIADPLKKEGIENFIISDSANKQEVSKEQARYFEYKGFDGELLGDITVEKHFSIVALSFNPDNKWRLNDGDNTYHVSINDKDFLEKVTEEQKDFAINDILVCEFRSRQYFSQNGQLKMEHSIEKVKDHKRQQRTPLISE